jgi:hypothetical protein
MSTTVGMDIDHLTAEEMPKVKERILAKKAELGLLMMEESARGGGYHLVFKRRSELSQEENLKWASELLEVEYDKGAKDITRVFFTTTENELLFLDDAIFDNSAEVILSKEPRNQGKNIPEFSIINSKEPRNQGKIPKFSDLKGAECGVAFPDSLDKNNSLDKKEPFPSDYHGIPFTDIIAKYWEVNNRGFEPTQGDRDTLTYQLACDLRHICGRNFEWLDQVIPCYDGFPLEEKRAKIKSALKN